jgi:methyl-accepting chemotaxis protein
MTSIFCVSKSCSSTAVDSFPVLSSPIYASNSDLLRKIAAAFLALFPLKGESTMNIFANTKVIYKLGSLMLISLIALSTVGYTGLYYLRHSNNLLGTMYDERLIPVMILNDARANVRAINGAVLGLMLTADTQKKQQLMNFIGQQTKQLNANGEKFSKVHLDAKAKELAQKTGSSMQKYLGIKEEVIALAAQNKNAQAYALYVAQVDLLADQYMDELQDFADYFAELSKQMKTDTDVAFGRAVKITFAIITGSLLLLGLSGFLIARAITVPLGMMVSVCNELAAGDFRDKSRQAARRDEIGQLADALTKMTQSVRALMKKVTASAEQLASSSEELTASADQSAQAANQIAISITDVAKGADAQLSAASDTSAVVRQIAASIRQIVANSTEVAGQSAKAADRAKDGGQSVNTLVSQMDQISGKTQLVAEAIGKLNDKSRAIGQFVATISGIAGQTNLLALNAAIEAARAGEQGRGFAVVAEEVRKLAEGSQEAAKQIAGLIGEIQGDTDQAVSAMNEGTREVQLGTVVVTTAGQVFREIASMVEQVASQVREISASIDQMASGSQQIVNSVQRIDQIGKKTASESQTVSAATEEQSASMEEIAAASQSLARLAQDMQTAVSQFRI